MEELRLDDVIKLLEKIRADLGNLRVGHTGHFGEFYPLEELCISVVTTDMIDHVRLKKEVLVVEIEAPLIGEEPD